MDLNWLQSIVYGLTSGLMDILPVSSQAHRLLLLKLFGADGRSDLMYLLIHLGIVVGLYINCTGHLIRMSRASRLSRIPKRKRKRPLDVKSLMDLSMLKTMLIPVILGMFLQKYTVSFQKSLLITSLFLLINGVILYAPQFLPTGNRDSRSLSRVEGLLMGLGGGVSVLPGISAMGAVTSIGSICGVDKKYCLDMAMLLNLFVNLGYAFLDVIGMASGGTGALSFGILMRYLFTGVAAFLGTYLGVKAMRNLSENHGFSLFGLYCFGLGLFCFILNLLV